MGIAETTLADMSYEEIESKLAERMVALEVLRQEPEPEKALN